MSENSSATSLIGRWTWVLALAWTLIAVGSAYWSISMIREHAFAEAKARATSIYLKDIEYRRWNAGHGGVYVPITEKTQPNPYLKHIPNRDVTTTSGKKLTLINPAYMTRQVHELMTEREDGSRGHITSLKPIRPKNAADLWERAALKRFEAGEVETFSIEKMDDGKRYFRYMHSMVVEKPCLKCHATQGYRLGDIRGGISVSVPVDKQMSRTQNSITTLRLEHGGLWLLGLGAIFIGGRMQMRAAEQLRKRQENFRTVFEHATDAIYLIDPETAKFIDCNQKAAEMTGYSIPELKKMAVLDLHPEDEHSQLPEIFKNIEAQGFMNGVSGMHHQRKDGSLIAIEVNASLVELAGKTINLSIVRNVTERIKGEEMLQNHVEELERFQKATVDREFRIKELRDELAAIKKEKE
ncbi:DUF3365 domain-containing protein [Pseudomonadota bacterium]